MHDPFKITEPTVISFSGFPATVETDMTGVIPDDELIELAFDALVPFANMAEVTESIELQDLRQARNVLRLLSERLTVAKKIQRS